MSVKKTEGSVFAQAHTAAANFASEKNKTRRMPSDHLEYDLMRSHELGYGPHYGKYKADHPETMAEYEAITGTEKVQNVAPGKVELHCPHCGKTFYVSSLRANKKYCSEECRKSANYERANERDTAIHCAWCGGEIPRGSHRVAYCCKDCYFAHRADRKKKKEEKANANP